MNAAPAARRRPRSAAAWVALLIAAGSGAGAQPGTAAEPTRGQLLYETHCIACHTTQMHWRDQRLARDWAGLQQQVRHWQGRANLNWTDDDVLEVVRHLNDRIYRYEAPLPPRSAAPPGPRVAAWLRPAGTAAAAP